MVARRTRRLLKAALRNEAGATAVEYAILLAIVGASIYAGITQFADQLELLFAELVDALAAVVETMKQSII